MKFISGKSSYFINKYSNHQWSYDEFPYRGNNKPAIIYADGMSFKFGTKIPRSKR
jgi:hypothetical protein